VFDVREPREALAARMSAALAQIYDDAATSGAQAILIVGHCDAFDSVLGIRLKNTETHVLEVTQ
jgi:hypothetical protein